MAPLSIILRQCSLSLYIVSTEYRWGASTIVNVNSVNAASTAENGSTSITRVKSANNSSSSSGYMGVVEVSQDAASKRLNAIANDVRHLNTALHTALFTSR
jgi:hypothetical protein